MKKNQFFADFFLTPFPLLCLLTFRSINIYSEQTFPLGMVRPGTVLNPSPPRVSQTFTLSNVQILMASLNDLCEATTYKRATIGLFDNTNPMDEQRNSTLTFCDLITCLLLYADKEITNSLH